MIVSAQIDAHLRRLTPAERRVAAVVADDPEAVAFGTVADVARRAGASGATVVRLATKLGFDGFVELQAAVREDITRRLRPASERIRRPAPGDVLGTALATEMANVAATLEGVDRAAFDRAVRLLSGAAEEGGRRRGSGRALILSGDASSGVASLFAAELSMLRPGVVLVGGSEVRVARLLADVGPSDVVVVIDLARYDRAVLDAAGRAPERGATLVALTDSALSPLAATATVTLTASVTGAGPFDSHVGLLALANALLAGAAARLRRSATDRLDQVEAAWRTAEALTDG
ncbi:MAG TPA: MurR/RpiR family transcriptional regulator [Acidimicrobiia bacterium]|jgi:DNA-binding MurR/RpiR family transcriptional regulator|nr:MurR/RpiR family transcriptional regulator [Acidimicrobiia bacterium]